jgi:hypothetical protein
VAPPDYAVTRVSPPSTLYSGGRSLMAKDLTYNIVTDAPRDSG